MKLSTRSRYGTRLMLELALHYGKGTIFLKEISKRQEISEKYLSIIILPLKSTGLVGSIRGARGGYMLAREPAHITLKEIIEALEGKISLVNYTENETANDRLMMCPTEQTWLKLRDTISEFLENITLESLVEDYYKTHSQSSPMYYI